MVYYLPFEPSADVDYYFLFSLIDIADYTIDTKAYDTITYQSIKQLADLLQLSTATLNRKLASEQYKTFFTVDKLRKVITINNSFPKGASRAFVKLTDNEVKYLRTQQDNLLCKYVIYVKYYCGYANSKQIAQNFTANQFLSAIGYSTSSNSNKNKINNYNRLLTQQGIITITKTRDDLGHTRNTYKYNEQ